MIVKFFDFLGKKKVVKNMCIAVIFQQLYIHRKSLTKVLTNLTEFYISQEFLNNIYSYLEASYLNFFLVFYFFYFFSIIFSFLFKHFLGLYGVFFLNFFSVFFFWLFTFLNINYFLVDLNIVHFSLFKWFYLNETLLVNFDIYIDSISYSFMLLTLTIALFVNIYTFSYFRNEPYVTRLISLINSFVLSMIILVSSGNLIVFFFGWELIGLTSFFLINFWSERAGTFKSALKAFTSNKFSDACIFFGIIIIYNVTKEIHFFKILNIFFLKNETEIFLSNNVTNVNLLAFFFLTAAFVKSAQIGFHIWLPDSMEAPVPASALIHSATLVSAGIFLILRFYIILDLAFFFHFILALVGSLTAFLGGASAAIQTDLKKILAYSTISHCGFLMFLCSLGNFNYVFIYLFIHGFFKASSFLCVGNIIRFSKNYQDIRRMGGYLKFLPAEFFFLSFSLLNLSGLPFFFGFYIKHTLFISFDYFYFKQIVLSFLFISALTGIFYSFKIIFFVFFDNKKARKSIYFDNIKNEKKSKFYTNSSLASNISIFLLIIFAYYISLNYIFLILYKNDTSLDLFSFFGKIQSFFFFNFEENILMNFSCFYWVSLILIVFLIILSWTKKILDNNDLNYFSFLFFIPFCF